MIEVVFWISLGSSLGFLILIIINIIDHVFSKTKYWKETIELANEMRAIKSKERRTGTK